MFKYIKAFFRGLYKILLAYPKIRKYAKNKDKYPLEERYAFVRKLVKIFFKSFNVEINANGMEKLNFDETYLYISNHQAVTDALTMVYLSEKPMTFVSKIEVKKYPFVGKVCYIIDTVFIDRDNIRDAVKMVKTCKEYLNNGLSVAIYPEGTRTKDDQYMPAEYKAGALKPAYETNKKIVGVVIDGSYKVLSTKYKNNLKVNVEFIEVLDFGYYGDKNTGEIAKEIYNKTIDCLNEIRKQ